MSRIVHLTSVHRPFDTRIFWKECRSLARAGHEVTLVVPYGTDQVRDGIRVLGVAPPSSRWVRMLSTARRVVERGLEEDPDVLHLHDPELLPWIRLLDWDAPPVIYDMHEHLTAQIETKAWVPPMVRPLVGRLAEIGLRVLLRGIPVIFAERSYADAFPWIQQCVVVQNMPLVGLMSRLIEPKYECPTLGYIGSVRPERGSFTVLSALAKLHGSGLEARWQCVGPVQEGHLQELRRMADDLGLLPHIEFTGYLPPREGWRRMSRCHVGLAVLQPTANYVGAYPTKLFEYMALGLPVVVSDTPLYRDVVEGSDCGLAVDPEDDGALAAALAKILGHPSRYREFGKRGRDAVEERYNWGQEEAQLLAFYKEILSTGKNTGGRSNGG